jgi:thiol-disulfide isomerase/thioredoxin
LKFVPKFGKHVALVLALATASGIAIQYTLPVHADSPAPVQDQPTQLTSEQWPQPAPQLIGNANDWLNTDGKPLQIQKGKVYLIDFWEYTCVNCLRTLPYLKQWNTRYAKDGLVIVGIHTPEFKFAKDRANVAAAVKKYGITWPVVNDSAYNNWQAYHNTFWPRKYFIDSKGQVVADHAGEGGYAESEALIQRLLKEANPDVKLPAIQEDIPERVLATSMTPELYAGLRGNQNEQHGNILNPEPGKTSMYKAPAAPLLDGKIYVQGVWTTEEESLRHGRETTNLNDKILLRYHARESNAVIKPEGSKPFRVIITQDGKPIARTDKGQDIQYDPQGASYLEIDQPRMYRITRNATFSSHVLTMASTSPDFNLYSFTFSATLSK